MSSEFGRRLLSAIRTNIGRKVNRLGRLHREASMLKQQYLEISNLLSAKRGRLIFEDVVKSYGADAADSALDTELATVQKSIATVIDELGKLKVELENVLKDYDSKEPLKRFRESFKELLALARVPAFANIDQWKRNKRPTDSGSPGPRSVIAYYAALWATIKDENDNLPSPMVIDSPNQNAQDRKNLEHLMALLAENTPKNAQVILCAEEKKRSVCARQNHHTR